MSKEKYEKIYSEHECVFGLEPTPIVKKIPKYIASGKVIDLGAGEGRNSLFLAEKGLEVTAIDSASVAVEKLKKFAKDRKVKLNALVGDVRTLEIPEGEDLILAILIFHHFSRQEALETIEKMKVATREGGLNVLNVIKKDSDFYRNDPSTDRFYVEQGELEQIYKDWEILERSARKWEAFQKRPDGSLMFNTSEEIIARKPADIFYSG